MKNLFLLTMAALAMAACSKDDKGGDAPQKPQGGTTQTPTTQGGGGTQTPTTPGGNTQTPTTPGGNTQTPTTPGEEQYANVYVTVTVQNIGLDNVQVIYSDDKKGWMTIRENSNGVFDFVATPYIGKTIYIQATSYTGEVLSQEKSFTVVAGRNDVQLTAVKVDRGIRLTVVKDGAALANTKIYATNDDSARGVLFSYAKNYVANKAKIDRYFNTNSFVVRKTTDAQGNVFFGDLERNLPDYSFIVWGEEKYAILNAYYDPEKVNEVHFSITSKPIAVEVVEGGKIAVGQSVFMIKREAFADIPSDIDLNEQFVRGNLDERIRKLFYNSRYSTEMYTNNKGEAVFTAVEKGKTYIFVARVGGALAKHIVTYKGEVLKLSLQD